MCVLYETKLKENLRQMYSLTLSLSLSLSLYQTHINTHTHTHTHTHVLFMRKLELKLRMLREKYQQAQLLNRSISILKLQIQLILCAAYQLKCPSVEQMIAKTCREMNLLLKYTYLLPCVYIYPNQCLED